MGQFVYHVEDEGQDGGWGWEDGEVPLLLNNNHNNLWILLFEEVLPWLSQEREEWLLVEVEGVQYAIQ